MMLGMGICGLCSSGSCTSKNGYRQKHQATAHRLIAGRRIFTLHRCFPILLDVLDTPLLDALHALPLQQIDERR